MTELYNSEDPSCLLWEKVRVLAQDRGFELSVECPLDKQCTGTNCVILEKEEQKKLDDLREELKAIREAAGFKEPIVGCW